MHGPFGPGSLQAVADRWPAAVVIVFFVLTEDRLTRVPKHYRDKYKTDNRARTAASTFARNDCSLWLLATHSNSHLQHISEDDNHQAIAQEASSAPFDGPPSTMAERMSPWLAGAAGAAGSKAKKTVTVALDKARQIRGQRLKGVGFRGRIVKMKRKNIGQSKFPLTIDHRFLNHALCAHGALPIPPSTCSIYTLL